MRPVVVGEAPQGRRVECHSCEDIDLFSMCSFTIAFLLKGGAEEDDRNPSFTWSGVRCKNLQSTEEDEIFSIPP